MTSEEFQLEKQGETLKDEQADGGWKRVGNIQN